MMASTSPGRACPLIPSRISTAGDPPATVTRTSSHVRNTRGSSAPPPAPALAAAEPGAAAWLAREKMLPSDQPVLLPGSGVPPPVHHQSGRDGLGVGAHRGSGDVAAMASGDA